MAISQEVALRLPPPSLEPINFSAHDPSAASTPSLCSCQRAPGPVDDSAWPSSGQNSCGVREGTQRSSHDARRTKCTTVFHGENVAARGTHQPRARDDRPGACPPACLDAGGLANRAGRAGSGARAGRAHGGDFSQAQAWGSAARGCRCNRRPDRPRARCGRRTPRRVGPCRPQSFDAASRPARVSQARTASRATHAVGACPPRRDEAARRTPHRGRPASHRENRCADCDDHDPTGSSKVTRPAAAACRAACRVRPARERESRCAGCRGHDAGCSSEVTRPAAAAPAATSAQVRRSLHAAAGDVRLDERSGRNRVPHRLLQGRPDDSRPANPNRSSNRPRQVALRRESGGVRAWPLQVVRMVRPRASVGGPRSDLDDRHPARRPSFAPSSAPVTGARSARRTLIRAPRR